MNELRWPSPDPEWEVLPDSNIDEASLEDVLADEVETKFARRKRELKESWERLGSQQPPPLDRLADLLRGATGYIQAVKTWHKERKAPFLADGRTVDRQQHECTDEVADLVEQGRLVARQHMQPGALIRGQFGALSASTGYAPQDVDYDKIDLDALRRYLFASATGKGVVDAALARFIADGGREIRGATIVPITLITIR